MRILLCGLLSATWVLGAVDGTIVNGTTSKPQPSVSILLVQPGQNGMQTLATVKSDAEGKFKIDKEYPPGPVLVQAIYSGVTYTQMIPPGTPATGLTVKVFDATKEAIAPAQHMILLEPSASALQVSETFIFDNQSQLTYSDPAKGSVQFYVPKDANGKIQANVNTTGGMPVPRQAEKTKQADVYKIDYPVKPGQTRFDIAYSLPAADAFSDKGLDTAGETYLVTPPSVTLTGDGIDSLGQEPQTHANTYRVRTASFKVSISGQGSLREQSASSDEDNGQPQIEQAPARVYTKLPWVLALTLGILALGGAMLYRKGAA